MKAIIEILRPLALLVLFVFTGAEAGGGGGTIIFQDTFDDQASTDAKWGTFKHPTPDANGAFRVVNGVLELQYEPTGVCTGPGFEEASIPATPGLICIQFNQKYSSNWTWGRQADKNTAMLSSDRTSRGVKEQYIFWWQQFGTGVLEAHMQHPSGTVTIGPRRYAKWLPSHAPPIGPCHEIRICAYRNPPGQSTGAVYEWLNGQQILNQTNIDIGTVEDTFWRRVWISGYRNLYRGTCTIPETMFRWVDNFTVFAPSSPDDQTDVQMHSNCTIGSGSQ